MPSNTHEENQSAACLVGSLTTKRKSHNVQQKSIVKYKKYDDSLEEYISPIKKAPSQVVTQLTSPVFNTTASRPKPKIVELLNLSEYSHQVKCCVPVDEPIFQPYPHEVTFCNYQPFREYEALLCLRNNDVVSRGVKVQTPDSQFFSITCLSTQHGQETGRVASGMEVVYAVKFRPQSNDDYTANLVVITEREKFIVPLVAVGAAPALDLPDMLDFGGGATKLQRNQMVLLRNLGAKATSFQLTTSSHFSVSPGEGSLAPGQVLQLRVGFCPPQAGRYEGELELRYLHSNGSSTTAVSRISGTADDIDVGLSTDTVQLLPTYVTKRSQKTFRIINASSAPMNFSVKHHSSHEEDAQASCERQASLQRHVQDLQQSTAFTASYIAADRSGGAAESDDEDAILSASAVHQASKLKDQAVAVALDQHLFNDPNFMVEPGAGCVAPGCEQEVVVTFCPDYARNYQVTAYVDVQGRTHRLPITFQAQGLGPAAVFSYDTLDVGDTYANTLHQYEVELQNRGKIDVQYQLLPSNTAFGSKFKFQPESGHISGGQIQAIKVHLVSDLLGQFDETFRWSIKGSSSLLSLTLRGRVRGPTCETDIQVLDFGVVSYGFRYTQELVLSNTSDIPLKYCWRVPQDSSDTDAQEFKVIPSKGSILPGGKQRVVVELVSHTIQKYNAYNLVLDIPDVSPEQLVVPIRAECAVPIVTAAENPLPFGECFVRYPYCRQMVLVNPSKLPAKFDIQSQDILSTGLATWTCSPNTGVIPALGQVNVEVIVTAQTLGRIQLPVRVFIPGSKNKALEVAIDARSMGPTLKFGSVADHGESLQTSASISFGTAPALQQHTYQLQIHNPCLIPATCQLFIEGQSSVFSVSPSELQLQPGGTAVATVAACLNDTREFRDTLHVLVSEGADVCIPVTATGSGHTLYAPDLSSGGDLSCGHQLVGRAFSRQVAVSNQGCKALELVWSSAALEEVRQVFSKTARATGKKFSLEQVPPESQPVFSVVPDKVVLQPGEDTVFTFGGTSIKAGVVSERFTCSSTALGSRTARPVFDFACTAAVASPMLELSSRCLNFTYTYTPDNLPAVIVQPLTVRNVSKLPLQCQLRVPPPFILDKAQLQLALFECATVNVSFDPSYKGDLQSGEVRNKLLVTYTDNPHKDTIDLVAVMNYPNLQLDKQEVNFGACLSDTTSRLPLTLTNTSNVQVNYHWAWEADSNKEDANSIASISLKQSRHTKPPAAQLFDILPIKGCLQPGETVTATASFFAYPGMKASLTAMCMVEGGPVYQMPFTGESNNVKYSVEPQFIDLGQQLFSKHAEAHIIITNQGKVPFDFNINTRLLSRPSIITPVPATGVVGPGLKQTVKLKVLPGIPERMLETVQVELAHFEPTAIQVAVEGVYPAVMCNLPRVTDDLFQECLQQAKEAAEASSLALESSTLPVSASMNGHRTASPGGVGSTSRRPSPMTGGKRGSGSNGVSPVPPGAGDDTRSIAGMSTAGKSVAGKSVAGKSIAGSAVTKAGGKRDDGGYAVAPEKRAELAAERMRLVRALADAELDQVRAAAQAALQAELQQAQQLASEQLQQQQQVGGEVGHAVSAENSQHHHAGLIQPEASAVSAASTSSAHTGRSSKVSKDSKVSNSANIQQQQQQQQGKNGPAVFKPANTLQAFLDVPFPIIGRKGEPIVPQMPLLAASHYILDFGCIIKGATKTRRFKLMNTSSQSASFRWDRSLLESWGLKVEPEAVNKLPGAPDCGAVDCTFSLATSRRSVGLGPMSLTVPLPIKSSLPMLLTIKADVQIPDFDMSQEVLDFGRVQAGGAGVITVQLHNTKPVFCEWEVRTPVEAQKCKDWQFFRCEPDHGTIAPGQKFNMRVIFSPAYNREQPYQQVIPIKVSNNPKGKELVCSGAGATPKVVFDPSSINCGAILPSRPGQAAAEARFTVTNPCTFPVELVSLDFDKQYLEDEEVLRQLGDEWFTGGPAGGCMYQVPLQPGAAMWPDVKEAAARAAALAAAAAAQDAQLAGDGSATGASSGAEGQQQQQDGVGQLEPVPAVQQQQQSSATDAAAGASVGESADEAKQDARTFVLLTGPDMIGRSEQAKLLGQRYKLPVMSFDDLLFEGADVAAPQGYDSAAAGSSAAPAAPPAPAATGGKKDAPPPPSFPPFPPVDLSTGFTWDPRLGDVMYSHVFTDPELQATQATYTPPHTKLQEAELHDVITRSIMQALTFVPTLSSGIVLDSLASRYVPAAVAMRLFLQATGLTAVTPPEPDLDPKAAKAKAAAAAKAKASGAAAEAPPPPTATEGWTGPHRVYLVDMQPEQQVLVNKLKQIKEEEEMAKRREAELQEQQQQEDQPREAHAAPIAAAAGAPPPVSIPTGGDTADVAPGPSPEEMLLAACQSEAAALAESHKEQFTALQLLAGPATGTVLPDGRQVASNSIKVLSVPVDTGMVADSEHLFRACCGLSFKLGARSCVLPELDSDKDIIPPPYTMQIVTRPRQRPPRKAITKFRLFTVGPAPPQAEEDKSRPTTPSKTGGKGGAAGTPKAGAKDKATSGGSGKSAGKDKAVVEDISTQVNPLYKPGGRWVLQPGQTAEMVVLFQSEELGRFTDNLVFEVVGGDRPVVLPLTGVCDYPRISSDYRNVFLRKVKARPSTPTISRQFVVGRNMFEFGPLLLGKDTTGYAAGAHPDNTARLRLTNNGLFPAHVALSFKSQTGEASGTGGKASPKKPAAGGKDAKSAAGQLNSVFLVSDTFVELGVDETKEIHLYAFPREEAEFEDALILTVTDNPEPVVFPVSVIGAKPQLQAKLDEGTAGQEAAAAAAAASDAPPKTPPGDKAKTPVKPGKKGDKEAVPGNKLLSEGIVFERLLVGKQETKTIILTNPGLLPVQWRLLGVQDLAQELSVSCSSGLLAARAEQKVDITFVSQTKREVQGKVVLEYQDTAGLLPVAGSWAIPIKAEGYKMEVDVKFPQDNLAVLDYGTVRVVDSKSLPLILKNNGKYPVKYAFTLRTATAKDLLSCSPDQGSVEPGKEVNVQVTWNAKATLAREMTLVNAPDIQLAIIEPLNSNKADSIPIRISSRAVFSKYSITPARGIIFGATTYNTTSKPRTFEICNSGDFPFDFRIYNLETPPPPLPVTPLNGAPDKKGGKGAAGGGGGGGGKASKSPAGGSVTIGPFTVEPAEACVEPGGKVEVSVAFKATGSQMFREVLGLDIGQRPVDDHPQGVPYEVVGESCIPGIDTTSLESIFEEHTISASLDPAGMVPCQLGLREKAFNFGPVIAALGGPGGSDTAAAAGGKAAAPAPAAGGGAVATGPLEGGLHASLKFSNPIKVPCTLNLSLRPKAPDNKTGPFPMSVWPSQLVIPPQESRYTTVYFAPTALCQFVATLEAVVEAGTDPSTKMFSCEVRGHGTLPTLSLLEPSATDSQGQPLLNFGKLLLGRQHSMTITLRNNGQLPASARMDTTHSSPDFNITTGPLGTFNVDPGRGVAFTAQFCPVQVGACKGEVRLKVSNNPFEDYAIQLVGDAYQDDVIIEQPTSTSATSAGSSQQQQQPETIKLQDAALGQTRQAVFCLRNTSSNKVFRFKFPTASPALPPSLSFSPAVGHLVPGTTKDITVTFSSDTAVQLNPAALKCSLIQVAYPAGGGGSEQAQDWDDRAQVLEYNDQQQPVTKAEPEPAVTDVPGTAKDLDIKVHAVADSARYTCGAPVEGILVKPTMMFQTRTYTFPLTNTSTCHLNYKFSVLSPDGAHIDSSGLYSVSPEGGTLQPGETASVTLRFSPREVVDCARRLVADIPGLDPQQAPLSIQLDGRVLRPWCHFDLVDSDYVSGGRREQGLPGPAGAVEPLDPATKVLEFESLGVRVRNTKRFLVLNPTAVGYEFEWHPAGAMSSSSSSPFKCNTKKGTIGPGRQFEMVFEYTPQVDQLMEAFWTFSIPGQSISLPFLLVGHVSEPRVAFDMPCLNFGQCLVGGARGHGTVQLVNSEDVPFAFNLDTSSYDATEQQVALTGRRPVVEFIPCSGVVPAGGRLALQATFSPVEDKLYNYNLVCKVANKPTKLSLNVKGEGYVIRQVLQLEGPDGSVTHLTPGQGVVQHINFGQVLVNERCVRTLSLLNTGSLAYDFQWDCGTNPRIRVSPETGTVGKGHRVGIELAYQPHGADKLRDYKITCQIVNGPSYTLLLQGAGHKPRLDCSFVNHDFGPCAVWREGLEPATKVLRLTNNDTQQISVDPQWSGPSGGSSNPHDADVWATDLGAVVLLPGQSKDAVITFRPAESRPYSSRLLLEINGLYNVGVELCGEGAPLAIEPLTPAHGLISFSAVPRGHSCSRTTTLVNRGRMAVTVSLGAAAQELLGKYNMSCLPAAPVLLRPRERQDYTLTYKPSVRQKTWKEPLELDVCGVKLPLLQLQGSCSGVELSLASDVLPFGPVAQGSCTVKRLALDNTGDVGTKFTWDTAALAPHFTITPAEGFLAAGQSAKLEVQFKPVGQSPDIRVGPVTCKVEGGDAQRLTLTGACFEAAAQSDVISLMCAVRSSASQGITIPNTSSAPWQLRPVISGAMFSGPEFLDVPPAGKAVYSVTYRPQSMTGASQAHEGSVFFGLPDGSGLLYKLTGTATSPTAEATIDKNITAKQGHIETLQIHNWLGTPQRFKIEIDKKSGDVSTVLEAAQYVDVPAHGRKDVKLSVYSYTASTTTATVTFRNEATGEYCFYDCKFAAGPAGSQGTLQLESPVRVQTSTKVTIRNPLDTAVMVRGSSSHKLVKVAATTNIEPRSSVQIPITFRPLLEGSDTGTLKLEAPELGVYEWDLRLLGAATNPEKALAFHVPLGGRDTQTFKFTHWLEDKADYKITFASAAHANGKVSVGMFEAAGSVSVGAAAAGGVSGVEGSVEVSFEPTTCGDSLRDMMILSSPTAGTIQVPLIGTCVAPRAQGPIDCSKGSGSVPFKNVFATDAEFTFSVDNPAFVVKSSEKLGGKKATNISVSFKPDPKSTSPPGRTAKMTVSCRSHTTVTWVYYLQA